jgi:hypothetical protein
MIFRNLEKMSGVFNIRNFSRISGIHVGYVITINLGLSNELVSPCNFLDDYIEKSIKLNIFRIDVKYFEKNKKDFLHKTSKSLLRHLKLES